MPGPLIDMVVVPGILNIETSHNLGNPSCSTLKNHVVMIIHNHIEQQTGIILSYYLMEYLK